MRWYDDLYVGYNLLDKKRQVMWKIKRGKQQFNKYVITLPFNDYDVLDIYPSNVLTQKWYKDSDIVIVGIAEGREEAMDMVQLIIMDCLNSTGGCPRVGCFQVCWLQPVRIRVLSRNHPSLPADR